jgi:hypothetical protein
VSVPNARQRRILSGLVRGDPVFEVPQESYFTQFTESSGRQNHVSLAELAAMQAHGWIQRISPGSGRCDHWEITDAGQEALRLKAT